MFRLVRYFSITSLVAFILVTVALAFLYRQTAVNDLIALGEKNNVALTKAFANSLWPEFAEFVNTASELDTEALRNHPETARLWDAVRAQMDGLSVIKVKVYDLNALTVFSTELAQIGEDKSSNAGYIAARGGDVATELTHRDTFSAFEQTIEDRDVISSYVPIRRGGDGPIEGVFEVYDDVTPLLNRIETTQRIVIVGVVVVLAVLYGVLYLIVRRGDRIMQQQTAERVQAEAARSASEKRLRTVMNGAPVMLWAADRDKKLMLLEGKGLPGTDVQPEQLIGRSIKEVYNGSTQIDKDMTEALSGKEHAAITTINGATFDIRYTPLHDDREQVIGVIGVATDISNLRLVEDALRDANSDLERRNQELERVYEFLNVTVDSLNNAVLRGASQPEMIVYLNQVRSQLKRLS